LSIAILVLWSGLLSLTAARFTLALGGPAADPRLRLAGGAALATVLLTVIWRLTPSARRTGAERYFSPLMLATVLPGLALLQVPLPVVNQGLALLLPQLADAPVEATRLVLAQLAWGLALLGLAVAVAVRLPRLAGPGRWRGLMVGLLAIHGALAVWTAQIQTLTGDEPHYLLAARSLVGDGDVDLTNDYGARLYREFFPSDALRRALPHLAPDLDAHDVPGTHGERRPVHQLGMSLLLAPGYALLGVAGARLTAVLLAALAGWLAVRLAVELTGESGWAGGLLVALLSPLLALGPTLHAEPAAVVCLTYLAWQAARPERGPRAMALAALAAGFLCWLHLKLLPAEVMLVAWLMIASRRAAERNWWLPLAGLVVGLVSQWRSSACSTARGGPMHRSSPGRASSPALSAGCGGRACPGCCSISRMACSSLGRRAWYLGSGRSGSGGGPRPAGSRPWSACIWG